MKDKNVSNLSDHRHDRKKGIVSTPLNYALRDQLHLTSWTNERMPEYLWLGLILLYLGRKKGLETTSQILLEISQKIDSLPHPKLSMIFNLSEDKQKIIYEIITSHVERKLLAPLTILYKSKDYRLFNEYFYISEFPIEDRICVLSDAIKKYYFHQSNEATDLRFLALRFIRKIHISKHLETTTKALQEYPYTEHEEEKMKMYRPTIRSIESGCVGEIDVEFNQRFWRDIGMITNCNPLFINFDENIEEYKDLIDNCKKINEYILHSNKDKSIIEDKFDVMIGSIIYALKIFNEINDHSLGNSILGRHGNRTIIEIFIMLKYLLKKEKENSNIWLDYKLYGISKYKLILLKARETDIDNTSHFIPPIADVLVNEIKWEEFIDIDLKYFDRQSIREKSIEVNEKELYDLYYDYDSNFSHGLWGAIRESSMLRCENASHQYHSIPDIYSNQDLPDVKTDSAKILKEIYKIAADLFNVPEVLSCTLGYEK